MCTRIQGACDVGENIGVSIDMAALRNCMMWAAWRHVATMTEQQYDATSVNASCGNRKVIAVVKSAPLSP